MFAVVKTGGKQYTVRAGDRLQVEKIEGKEGDKVELDNVLMAGSGKDAKTGSDIAKGAKVLAEIVRQFRDDKVIVFKKKRRHNYRRKKGHRQYITELKVTDIKG